MAETGPVGLGEECGSEWWHGRATGYRVRGCKGDACQKWNRDRLTKARRAKDDGVRRSTSESKTKVPGQGALEMGVRRVAVREAELVAPCWCEKKFLAVAKSEIKAGRTRSCGLSFCVEKAG